MYKNITNLQKYRPNLYSLSDDNIVIVDGITLTKTN
ncbi:hypothetical protein J2Y03_003499 [Neobacillus niacini]|nr:hypothetical protein [Neobacillus niacini]